MEKLLINTPQNVRIEYQPASVGTRLVSLAIDYAIMICYGYLAFKIFGMINGNSQDRYLKAGTAALLFLPIMLYHLILESFLGGQTVGKILLKTKVVLLDGSRATSYEYFIRWVLNIVDIWMMGGVIGLLSIVLSKKSQRLGDLAAGTTVVSLKARIALTHTIYEDLTESYLPVYPEYMIRKLSDKDINIIKQSFNEAKKSKKMDVLTRLSNKITEVTGAEQKEKSDIHFIEIILKDHYHYHKEL